MLEIVDKFYENESTQGDPVLSKEEYEEMADDIKGAYASLMKKIDAAATKVMEKKTSIERQNEQELKDAISSAQST